MNRSKLARASNLAPRTFILGIVVAGAAILGACSSAEERRVTLVAYDSFPLAETTLNDALAEFSEQTGIEVEILSAGDTGTMVSKAILTAGNPEGDVIWGVDNTFLTRSLDIFEPYVPSGSDAIPSVLRSLVPDNLATPVTYGDVCINIDLEWFASRGLAIPTTLDDLRRPEYRDLLVVENPATSSPGLAFMLATIARYGPLDWQTYWSDLRANGVAVADSWTEAYYERFTWAGGGDRPLVVSYGSSPPAEVIFADPPRGTAPTGVMVDSCFRQVEFAGILRGTRHPESARALMDFLVSNRFQSEIALNLFVYPANLSVELPAEFTAHTVIPEAPRWIDPDTITTNRAEWIERWNTLVLK